MAVRKAQASGNWNSTATWSGGVVPSYNDTVYANGFNISINQAIDLTGSTVDTSGSFIPGQIYQIVSLGTTNFTLTANCIVPGTNASTPISIVPSVGAIFQAVNAGTATTGTAKRLGALLNFINTPLTIVTGGGFTLTANNNVTGAYIQAGTANCLTISGSSSPTLTGCYSTGSAVTTSTRAILFSSTGTLTLNNMVAIGGRVNGTAFTNGAHAIESTSTTGTVQFTNSSIVRGGSGNYSCGMNNNTTGIVTYSSGTIFGGSGGIALGINNNSTGNLTVTSTTITGGSVATAYGIQNVSTGPISVNSSTVTGGTNATAYGIYNLLTGGLTFNSTTINASSTAPAIFNASSGSITSTGNVTASNGVSAIVSSNASATVTVSGSLIHSENGTVPISAPRFLVNPDPSNSKIRYAKNGTTTYTDFLSVDSNASPSDVRFGTVYGQGLYTGTLRVPSPSSVAYGALTDNTTGTAVLTQSAIWDTLTSSMTTSGSIGERLANASTVAVTGQQITNALG